MSIPGSSLSLHYFPWSETTQLVERLREALTPGGLLLCRLNSINDRNHGAVGHLEIDRHYYRVAGAPKRFSIEPTSSFCLLNAGKFVHWSKK